MEPSDGACDPSIIRRDDETACPNLSLPFMGRVVAKRPGGEGVAKRKPALMRSSAPTRLTLRVSRPPQDGEGERSPHDPSPPLAPRPRRRR